MSHMTISIILLIFLLIHQSVSVGHSCSAILSNDFTDDCDNGHLKDFAVCLHNTKSLNSTTVADELNRQYCKAGECDFFCLESNGPGISCTCMCADTGGQSMRHKRAIICNDCFKFEFDEINIRFNAGSNKSVKFLMIFTTMMIALIAY